jgi:tRNA-dihydrouridine synthase
MNGRAAYHNPWLLTELEAESFGRPLRSTRAIVRLESDRGFVRIELVRMEHG